MLQDTQKTALNTTFAFPDNIEEWINQFYRAKKLENVSAYTLTFYKQQLGHFIAFCDAQLIENISQISPNGIREYMLWMEESGHNAGGVHAAFRTLKAFLRWFDEEAEPVNWRNPINKIKAPRLPMEPIRPVEIHQVQALIKTCGATTFLGKRDKALFLFLLDTGVRARELLAINLEDTNLISGAVMVRKGKGRKFRTVFMGRDTLRAVRSYLRERSDKCTALFITDAGERLHYGGMRNILVKHSKAAGVPMPSPHDFRRAFALNMLRNGTDLITLARLMGHTTLKVLQLYLAQLPEDLQEIHRKNSPVDRSNFQNGDE